MKCARFPSKGANIEIAQVPIPNPGPGQVRMKVHYCGVCHSDTFTKVGAMGNSFPRTPGHEAAGVVDAVGEGVKDFKKGDRVGLGWFGGNCHACAACRDDDRVVCDKLQVPGIHFDGGYAEYLVTSADTLARIPDDLPFEHAAPLMCAGITVFNGIRNQGLKPGELVGIQGIGGLGHLAIQFAKKMGYKVVAISSGDEKAALAKELGAHHYINASKGDPVEEMQKLGGAKLLVATAPHAKSMQQMIKSLKHGGKLLINAVPHEPLAISGGDLIMKKLSVSGWPSGDNRDSEDTMQFAVLSDVRAMIEVFPLEKAQEALEHMESNKVRFRGVLKIAQ